MRCRSNFQPWQKKLWFFENWWKNSGFRWNSRNFQIVSNFLFVIFNIVKYYTFFGVTIFFLQQLYGQQEQNQNLPLLGITKLWKSLSAPRGVGGPKFFGHELGVGIPWKWTICGSNPRTPFFRERSSVTRNAC